MCRHFAAGTLSMCVVLLMFGTSSLADDLNGNEVIFDLSAVIDEPAPASNASEQLHLAVFADDRPGAGQAYHSKPTDAPGGENLITQDQAAPAAPVMEGGLSSWRRPAPSYPLPSRSFSLYQSPASYGWDYFERCAPTPYTPRGNGIPKRTSCFRMDYRPYTLQHTESVHGPAFYQRFELYPCEECHLHGKHLKRYYGVRGH